jgi:plasmid stabilization system protein ParE
MRPLKSKYYLGTSWYANFASSVDGALFYSAPGVAIALPQYEAAREMLEDVVPGLGTVNPCKHYRCLKKHISESEMSQLWRNPSDHTFGTWIPVGAKSNSSQWLWDESYGGGWLLTGTSSVGPKGKYGTWSDPIKDLPVLHTELPLSNTFNCVGIEGWSDLVQSSLKAMTPGIRPANNISLLNSIYELKDYRNLAVTVRNLIRRIRTYPIKNTRLFYNRQFVNWWNTVRDAPLQSACRIMAGQYLNAEFNLLPLMQDICSVQKALSDYREQFRKLARDANTRKTHHFKRELRDQFPDSYDSETCPTTNAIVSPSLSYGRSVTYLVRQFNATLVYSYSLPLGAGDENLPWALMDALGVNLNPAIIWRALKWSFVVDWLVGVSQYLDRFKVRNIEPSVIIHSYCASAHVKRVITTNMGFGTSNPCFEQTEETYERVPGLQNAYSSIRLSGLSPMEFSLGAALAASR